MQAIISEDGQEASDEEEDLLKQSKRRSNDDMETETSTHEDIDKNSTHGKEK